MGLFHVKRRAKIYFKRSFAAGMTLFHVKQSLGALGLCRFQSWRKPELAAPMVCLPVKHGVGKSHVKQQRRFSDEHQLARWSMAWTVACSSSSRSAG